MNSPVVFLGYLALRLVHWLFTSNASAIAAGVTDALIAVAIVMAPVLMTGRGEWLLGSLPIGILVFVALRLVRSFGQRQFN